MKKLTVEQLVKLMDDNDITIQDIAKAKQSQASIWCLDDFIEKTRELNETYGHNFTEEKIEELAKNAFEAFSLDDYDSVYELIWGHIESLVEQAIDDDELENS